MDLASDEQDKSTTPVLKGKEGVKMDFFLFEDEEDARTHRAAMDRLAASIGVPLEKIRPVYEEILWTMRQEATIKHFLVILVARKVKELFRGNHFY